MREMSTPPADDFGQRLGPTGDGTVVNDVHSQLNATRVHRVVQPASVEALRRAVLDARAGGRAVSIAGGRHAMGGQQFGTDTVLLDMTAMRRVLAFDAERGRVEVEAGIRWPELIGWLIEVQRGRARQWGIIQKQTGADRLTLGGALAANVHGRGLRFKPIVADVESLLLVDARVPRTQAAIRSGGTVSERLVPTPPGDIRERVSPSPLGAEASTGRPQTFTLL
jgi:FAD/FMN-containing dehydrogenase